MASVKGATKGYRSTEFWLALASAAGLAGGEGTGVVPEPWGTVGAAVVSCVYIISRAVLKLGIVKKG